MENLFIYLMLCRPYNYKVDWLYVINIVCRCRNDVKWVSCYCRAQPAWCLQMFSVCCLNGPKYHSVTRDNLLLSALACYCCPTFTNIASPLLPDTNWKVIETKKSCNLIFSFLVRGCKRMAEHKRKEVFVSEKVV